MKKATRKLTKAEQKIFDLIEQEIFWCEKHDNKEFGTKDFRKGFIKGLEQAQRFVGI